MLRIAHESFRGAVRLLGTWSKIYIHLMISCGEKSTIFGALSKGGVPKSRSGCAHKEICDGWSLEV